MTDALSIYIGLLLARIGAFVMVMPPFAGRTPRSVRAALVLAVAAFYLGTAPPTWDSDLARRVAQVHPILYGFAIIREMLLGAAMGFALTLFILPARIAGEFITQQMGLNAALLPSPSGQDPSGPLTQIFETMASFRYSPSSRRG
jgi:flagellar biosynthetic protein FliR